MKLEEIIKQIANVSKAEVEKGTIEVETAGNMLGSCMKGGRIQRHREYNKRENNRQGSRQDLKKPGCRDHNKRG